MFCVSTFSKCKHIKHLKLNQYFKSLLCIRVLIILCLFSAHDQLNVVHHILIPLSESRLPYIVQVTPELMYMIPSVNETFCLYFITQRVPFLILLREKESYWLCASTSHLCLFSLLRPLSFHLKPTHSRIAITDFLLRYACDKILLCCRHSLAGFQCHTAGNLVTTLNDERSKYVIWSVFIYTQQAPCQWTINFSILWWHNNYSRYPSWIKLQE